MKLFNYWRSSASWRVRIGLHLKGLEFEYVPVHLVDDGGQQHQADYKAKNPMAQVPTLVVEHAGTSFSLTQSLAILELLDETWPEPALLPKNPVLRAHARRLAEIVNSGIQPLQNLSVTRRLEGLGVDTKPWLSHFIGTGLAALEAAARDGAGRFLVGDEPSLADCCLVPQLYSARRFGVALDGLPTLLRVEATCAALPAFERAHPDVQPDAPARAPA